MGAWSFLFGKKEKIARIRGLVSRAPDGSIFIELMTKDKAALDAFDRVDNRIRRLNLPGQIDSVLSPDEKTLSILVSPPKDTEKKTKLRVVKTR